MKPGVCLDIAKWVCNCRNSIFIYLLLSDGMAKVNKIKIKMCVVTKRSPFAKSKAE